MSKETGGPAFPREDYQANGHERGFEKLGQEGMSVRDYFAVRVMQSLTADSFYQERPARVAELAYLFADSMLAERSKP